MQVLINDETPLQKLSEGVGRKLIHLDNLMMVICEFTNGPMAVPDPPHSHPHEQITYVAKGEIKLFAGEECKFLEEGDVYAIPENVPHCIQTLSEYAKLIDSFNPIRQEFL
jgi:quercetin dioxygenase-like cupin family protein